MPKEKISLTEKLSSSFKQLAVASVELDVAAADLGKTISAVESSLQTIGTGVSAWHAIAQGMDRESGDTWSREIGYSKIGTKWCIALKRTWGNDYHGEGGGEEIWKFSDAPRWMSIEAVGRIPDLLDELSQRTLKSTADIKSRTEQAQEFASVLASLSAEIVESRKKGSK